MYRYIILCIIADLYYWFEKNDIWIAPAVRDFEHTLLKANKKKKGRPQDCPEIILKLTNYFRENGFQHIEDISELKDKKHEAIQPLAQEYLKDSTLRQKTRRLQTLRGNINKALNPSDS